MLFLEQHSCVMNFGSQSLKIRNKDLQCTDRHGAFLQSNVQVVYPEVIPSHLEKVVTGRLCVSTASSVGLIESVQLEHSKINSLMIGASLGTADKRRHVSIRCINVTAVPVQIKAGTCVAMFQPVAVGEVVDIKQLEPTTLPTGNVDDNLSAPSGWPDHFKQLHSEAVLLCKTSSEIRQVTQLLTEHQNVFSKSDTDVGRTHLVEHSIPVKPGTTSIRQAPRRLGPEKEAEVESQVKELSEQGLITPSSSAWSSPNVLVKRKDGKWPLCID